MAISGKEWSLAAKSPKQVSLELNERRGSFRHTYKVKFAPPIESDNDAREG